MKVFLAGSTGAIGKRLVPLLVESGHEVTALVRSSEKGKVVEAMGATPAVADPLDRDALTKARGGSNAKAKRELGWQPVYPSWRRGFVEGLG